MADSVYTAEVHVAGGRNGGAKTADGSIELQLKGPVEMGGQGGGLNPEQLFAMGFAACFESNLRVGARKRSLDPKGTGIVSKVSLVKADEGGFKLAVAMEISMPNITDAAAAAEMVKEAHAVCPYSRATKGNIDTAFTINGQAVAV